MATKKCPVCGAEVDDKNAFCGYCGAKMDQPQETAQNTTAEGTTAGGNTQKKTFVAFEVNAPTTPVKPKNEKHTGAFVGGIVCFVLAIIFSSLYAFQYINIISTADSEFTFVSIFLYILLIGWITIVPSIGLLIATGICTGSAIKSTSKAIKVISIIILTFTIILALAIVLSFVLPTVII